MPEPAAKLEQKLGWIVLALLLAGCGLVLRPFLSAILWAGVLCFASWPIYARLLALLRGRRTLAAACMSLGMILVLVMPFAIVLLTLADNVTELTAATQRWLDAGPPAPPAWLVKVPLIGQQANDYWLSIASDSAKLIDDAKRFVQPVAKWLLSVGIVLGGGLVEFALSIFVAFFLFRDGIAVAQRLTRAVERIGGEHGLHLLKIAGGTVRGVVYGILGTALVQAVMAGIGFLIAGVPGAGVLTLLTFFLSVVPVGPPLVWIPAALWLFSQGSTGWGVFMIIWGLGVSSVDNFVKPLIISQGSDMPFLLILFGVLGGAIAFGFIGVFLGPTLLAVGFRMITEWSAARRAEAAPGA